MCTVGGWTTITLAVLLLGLWLVYGTAAATYTPCDWAHAAKPALSLMLPLRTSAIADTRFCDTSWCVSCFVFALGVFDPEAVAVPW
jgi:hypothetical protein